MFLTLRLILTFFCLILLACLGVAKSKPRSHTVQVTEAESSALFEGEWMVMFYAPWCPACQSLKPTWESFANQWSEELSISVALININKNPGLSGQFLVFQLPTIFHVKDGVVRPYTAARSSDAFVSWVSDKSYRNIDPIAWWKNPNSIQMKAVGHFFRFANLIKDLHEQLNDTYNLPTWAVYCIFAAVTIIAGLIIGMMMVIVCDCIFPPKPMLVEDNRQYSKVEILPSGSKKKSTKKKGAETEVPEEIDDQSDVGEEKGEESENTEGDGEEEIEEKVSGDADEESKTASVRKRKPRKD